MKSIFITGAAGWLGVNLLEFLHNLQSKNALDAPDRIVALVALNDDTDKIAELFPKLEIRRINVTDPRTLTNCFQDKDQNEKVVIHCAGVIHPRFVSQFYKVNVTGTRNVFQAAELQGVSRVVYLSSNSPCGCNSNKEGTFDEESPYSPYMNYGRSKMQAELVAREFHSRGKVSAVIVRAPWFYGPHQPERQKLFFRMIRGGRFPIVGDGLNKRSMVYTENLAQGLLKAALEKRAAGQTYWIADSQPYTMLEIIETVRSVMAKEFGQYCASTRIRVPSVVSELALACDTIIQGMGFYHSKIHVLSEMNKTIACSIKKAADELRYTPTIALREGMFRSMLEVFGPQER